jgi:hypothetical protein
MSIFPSSPSVGDEYSGYRWNGTVWEVIGIDLNADYATTAELAAHEIDSTDVHSITDTTVLATESYVDTAESDAVSSANTYTDNSISTHNATVTSVHGIADTTALVAGDGITDIVALTQAEYDALTPDATTLYVVTD